MARTKGEVIALRLPLEVHNRAVATAAARGVSVGQLVATIVDGYLAEDAVLPSQVSLEQCVHPGSELVLLPQGMRRCGRCHAVRGTDGVWRRRDLAHSGVWLSEVEGTAGGDIR